MRALVVRLGSVSIHDTRKRNAGRFYHNLRGGCRVRSFDQGSRDGDWQRVGTGRTHFFEIWELEWQLPTILGAAVPIPVFVMAKASMRYHPARTRGEDFRKTAKSYSLAMGATFVCALLTAVAIGADRPTDPADKIGIARAYQRGLSWVLDQQAADGGWHSETYGIMRGGAGNTAQVVWALSRRPGPWSEREVEAYQRGLTFLTSRLDGLGLVRGSESVADFPVAATALTLTAIANRSSHAEVLARQRMIDGLIRAQRRSGQVGGMEDRDWGGWGMFADAGISNVSTTAQALVALNASRSLTAEVRENALAYLARMQHGETVDDDSGGFFFTPQADHPLNKAGWVEEPDGTIRARATVSSTCDGLAALLACGVTANDRRVIAARNWLIRAAIADQGTGADGSVIRPEFRLGLEFYEGAAWSRIWKAIDDPRIAEHWRRIVASLIRQQSPDGSWQNAHPGMREDDPLIATAFALSVLGPMLKPTTDPKP